MSFFALISEHDISHLSNASEMFLMDLKKPTEFYLYNCTHIAFPYPGLQEQVNDPWVLWHKAFSWQLLKLCYSRLHLYI